MISVLGILTQLGERRVRVKENEGRDVEGKHKRVKPKGGVRGETRSQFETLF